MSNQAEFLEHSGVDHLYVSIPREDLESRDLAYTLSMLMPLVESRKLVRRFENRVSLFFDGYNDDPREVFDIPEARVFMSDLEKAFPYFIWFFCTDDATLRLAAYLLCDLVSFKRSGPRMQVRIDPIHLAAFMSRQFHALNYLAERFGLDELSLSAVTDRTTAHFQVAES